MRNNKSMLSGMKGCTGVEKGPETRRPDVFTPTPGPVCKYLRKERSLLTVSKSDAVFHPLRKRSCVILITKKEGFAPTSNRASCNDRSAYNTKHQASRSTLSPRMMSGAKR